MPPLQTLGFHHVTLVSRDAERTRAFYADLLGLTLVKRTVNFDDPTAAHLYFGDFRGSPGTLLTFFEWPQLRRGRWGIGGVHHVALGVADADALLRWKRRLSDAGVRVNGPLDRGYFHSLYFTDPDGQILEIATEGPGYAIDEAPDRLGERFIEPLPRRLPKGRNAREIARATHPEPVREITAAMRLSGIHHISGITDDLDRAGTFYEQALGLRLVKRTLNQDDGVTEHRFWARYDGAEVAPRSSWTLFGWNRTGRRSRPGAGLTHHVAFRARNAEELDSWRERLLGLGIEVSPVTDRRYFQSIYFRAPDGVLVELATDGPGFGTGEAEEGESRAPV